MTQTIWFPPRYGKRIATAMWWLARGLRALVGIEPIRTERRN